MVLVKEGLWLIVSGTEVAPSETEVVQHAKFVVKCYCALELFVLSVDPMLLGLHEHIVIKKYFLCSDWSGSKWLPVLKVREHENISLVYTASHVC